MTDEMPSRPATCPRFDECDPRCSARLTLGHLDEVFRVCHSDYESCPLNAGALNGGALDRGGLNRGGLNQGGLNQGGLNQGGLNQGGFGSGGLAEGPCESIGEGASPGCALVGRFSSCDGPLADERDALVLAGLAHIPRSVELTIGGRVA